EQLQRQVRVDLSDVARSDQGMRGKGGLPEPSCEHWQPVLVVHHGGNTGASITKVAAHETVPVVRVTGEPVGAPTARIVEQHNMIAYRYAAGVGADGLHNP